MSDLREFQDALLVRNIVSKTVRAMEHSSPEEMKKYLHDHPGADPKDHKVAKPGGGKHEVAYEALKKSKVGDIALGMAAEAKKSGAKFGLRDAKDAMEAWFDGGREPTTPAQKAARTYLESSKGKSLLKGVTDTVHKALKAQGGKVGYKDIGEAIVAYLGE